MAPPPPPGYYPQPDRYWAGNENFARRQMASFGPPESHSPSTTPIDGHRSYDPSATHSLHGSQSSHHEQEVGPPFYNQYPPTAFINGSNGHIDNVHLYQPARDNKSRTHAVPFIPQPPPAVQFPPLPDVSDGLVGYLQHQFSDPTFADWTLELRYTDDRSHPVQVPGHSIIFARSPLLKEKMLAQGRENQDVTPRPLLIESSDIYLRSDGFWMAMQRLYGVALLAAGTTLDRFELGLGYAAAGHLLVLPQVVSRGIEIASYYLTWATLETALDFGLDGGIDSNWTSAPLSQDQRHPATYGPAVNLIVQASLNLVINNFPADFLFDVTVFEPDRNRRLPIVSDARPTSQNPRFAGIQFGTYPTHNDSPKSPNATLSRVLLNLPFPLLKYILESRSLGHASSPLSTLFRNQIIQAVIDEREKRRVKVQSSQVPDAERIANSKEWDVVGFQETFDPVGSNDAVPGLSRTWVDFKVPVTTS